MIKNLLYKIESAKDGNPTLIVEEGGRAIALHSRINPVRESDTAAFAPDPDKYDLLILLGCGLGYSLLKLEDLLPGYRQVIVIDILPGIENEIRKNPHTSFLAENEKVRFFTGINIDGIDEVLSSVIDLDEFRGIQVVEHHQSLRVFSSYYNEVRDRLKKIIDKKAGDSATIRAFGNLFLRNALNNLKSISSCAAVSSIAGRFAGKKAVIVSSAPSIEDNLEKLEFYKNGIYIIAVDSALPVLRCAGIEPDFVISIDPQGRIGEHFLGHASSGAVHVFSIVSPPQLVEKYGGYISFNSHPVSQIVEDMYPGITGSIDSATGSVAGDAFMFAYTAGFEYIAMTGFDFSFSNNIIYARETAYQKRYTGYFNNRFKTPETFNAAYIFKSSGSLAVDRKYTRRAFLNYRNSLDLFIKEKNFKNIFMINRRGLPLKNAEQADFDSFMQLPGSIKENKSEYIREIKGSKIKIPADLKKIRERLLNERVLDAIISESLGNEVSAERRKKIIEMIEGIE